MKKNMYVCEHCLRADCNGVVWKSSRLGENYSVIKKCEGELEQEDSWDYKFEEGVWKEHIVRVHGDEWWVNLERLG